MNEEEYIPTDWDRESLAVWFRSQAGGSLDTSKAFVRHLKRFLEKNRGMSVEFLIESLIRRRRTER